MPRKPKRHLETPETTLYAPVKRYLKRLGFMVKGEVCGCNLVALRGNEPPIVVIGELKLAFSLELVEGMNRTAACDEVWLAVHVAGRWARVRDPRVHKLCRFLGFGLLGVSSAGSIEVLVEPKPWRPRQAPSAALSWCESIEGPRRTSEIRSTIPNAPDILLRNVYGWFTRVQRGVYKLTQALALARWPQPVVA